MKRNITLALAGSFAALLATSIAGCSGGQTQQSTSGTPAATTETSTHSAPSTARAEADVSAAATRSATANLSALSLKLVKVTDGLRNPLLVTNAKDGSGRLFVVEQAGLVRVVRGGTVSSKPFLDIRSRVSSGGERGLLGLAFAPDYAKSGRFYVDYTNRNGDTVVARFVAANPAADSPKVTGPTTVFFQKQPYPNHNGGCIVFAPDGTLWVGMGDGGSAGDPQNHAQNKSSRLGKILSLDVEQVKGRPTPKMIHHGLRNPWRFSFDAPTQTLWIADVGQNAWEEVDVISQAKRGLNFGWNRWEGNHPYPPGASRSKKGYTFPAFEYPHPKGESITGGYVYRGNRFSAMQGVYFYGDFVKGWIAGAARDTSGKVRTRDLLKNPGIMPSSFGLDEAGEMYVCDYNGAVLRLEPK